MRREGQIFRFVRTPVFGKQEVEVLRGDVNVPAAAFEVDLGDVYSLGMCTNGKYLFIAVAGRHSVNIQLPIWKIVDKNTFKRLETNLTFGRMEPEICNHSKQNLISGSISKNPLILTCHNETFVSMPIAKFEKQEWVQLDLPISQLIFQKLFIWKSPNFW